ncbi:interferon-induced, double-stranded RNA-activated protein kinase-like [Gambusia affinis]|uniref:interferon-induced, double-stranded RNA-activated protein kinase-like n=1 Tax=Gambusia affinis TaxID=33528 RepID=UPI001CDB69F7|nr:interferon-induced, double-stranded RNA-activated protein kinase-like [Gambusia affinis]
MMELLETGNAISNLNIYAQKRGLNLFYEGLDSEGPDHNKQFSGRFLLDGKPYPSGMGKNKKDAKLNAAQNALRCLCGDQQQDTAEYSAETSSPARQNDINYICWLNQYGQTKRVKVEPVETARPGLHNPTLWCKFIVGDTEYPEVSGKSRREAKEEAAKVVYNMINTSPSPEVIDSPVHQNQMLNKNLNRLSVKTKSLSINSEDSNFTEPRFAAIIHNYCQKKNLSLEFILVEKSGPPHDPRFSYKLKIETMEYRVAEGKKIKEAKENAAKLAWSALQEQSDYDSKVSVGSTASEDGAATASQSDALNSNELSSHNMQTTSSDLIIFADSSNPSNAQISRKTGSEENEPSPMSQDSSGPSQSEMTGSSDPADSSNQNDVEKQKITNTSNPPVQSSFTSDFEILGYLGGGGFGRVFMVTEKLLDLVYAVKIVPGTPKALREVTALSELQHENIVRYYNCWMEDSKVQQERVQKKLKDVICGQYLFIKMELCDSATLKQWIGQRNEEELPHSQRGADSLPIALQIVDGVEYIHSNNFIHRDLKPLNIMFGKNGKVKIGDFGLVTIDKSEILIDRTEGPGTKIYMAPEQESNTYDRKVDIFSLGLIFFELLWKISTGHERAKIWENARNNKLPKEFSQAFPFECRIIKSLLSENPDDRPEASQVKEQLEEANQHLDQHSV